MNILGMRGFWLKTILIGNSPNVVVIRELFSNRNNYICRSNGVFFFISVCYTSKVFL